MLDSQCIVFLCKYQFVVFVSTYYSCTWLLVSKLPPYKKTKIIPGSILPATLRAEILQCQSQGARDALRGLISMSWGLPSWNIRLFWIFKVLKSNIKNSMKL